MNAFVAPPTRVLATTGTSRYACAHIKQAYDDVGLKAKPMSVRVPSRYLLSLQYWEAVIIFEVMSAQEVNEAGEYP